MPLILGTNSIKDTGFNVANSCRFEDGDNPKMVVTPSSSGTNAGLKYTFSAWVKLGDIGADKTIWSCSSDTYIYISGAGVISCNFRRDSGSNYEYNSTRKLRDPSAWYHIVLRVDTTDSTDADKVQVYVNNQEDTPTTTTYRNMADDYETGANVSGIEQRIGVYSDGSLDFDGYMAEVIMVDNQSLAPTEFGEYDEDTPTIWKPKDISGISVGTNGYYLDFEDSSNLGNNAAGSGSADLTETNLAATDSSTDTPTNNFATYNPLLNTQNVPTFAEGNTQAATTGSGVNGGFSSIGVASAKWYVEFKLSAHSGTNRCILGVTSNPAEDDRNNEYFGQTARSYSYSAEIGRKYNNNSASSYGDSYTTNDILGVALDLDNLKIYFSKNGTWQDSGDPTSGATGTGAAFTVTAPASTDTGFYFFGAGDESGSHSCTIQANFGNPPYANSSSVADANGYGAFEYAPPSGYLALCTKNLGSDGG